MNKNIDTCFKLDHVYMIIHLRHSRHDRFVIDALNIRHFHLLGEGHFILQHDCQTSSQVECLSSECHLLLLSGLCHTDPELILCWLAHLLHDRFGFSFLYLWLVYAAM